jgi:hypothetical protein
VLFYAIHTLHKSVTYLALRLDFFMIRVACRDHARDQEVSIETGWRFQPKTCMKVPVKHDSYDSRKRHQIATHIKSQSRCTSLCRFVTEFLCLLVTSSAPDSDLPRSTCTLIRASIAYLLFVTQHGAQSWVILVVAAPVECSHHNGRVSGKLYLGVALLLHDTPSRIMICACWLSIVLQASAVAFKTHGGVWKAR